MSTTRMKNRRLSNSGLKPTLLWHNADCHRVRLRCRAETPHAGSLAHERRRLGGTGEEYQDTMLSDSIQEYDPAPLFAALGDRTRLSLLAKLSDGHTRSIAGLSADTRSYPPGHHEAFACSRKCRARHEHQSRAGQASSPSGPSRSRRCEPISSGVSQQWDDALLRLRSFVER